MADFLVLVDARVGSANGSGPTTLRAGTVLSDPPYSRDELASQGVALVPYVPSAMAPIVEQYRKQAGKPGERSDLVALLGAAGLIGGGWVLAPEGDHFDAIANMHIGTPDNPAELWVGGGGPFNGSDPVRIVVWARDDLGNWTDLSESPSPIELPSLEAGAGLYFAARNASGPVQVVGWAIDNDQVLDPTGGAVAAEYWNGAWTDMASLSTDRVAPYRPYGHNFLQRAPAQENVRYPEGIKSDWVTSDPMGKGVVEYWSRVQVTAGPIAQGPRMTFERAILDSVKFNRDGWAEYFGAARNFQSFGWDVGLLKPASASPGDQDVFRSKTLDVGRTENLFQNAGLRRIAFVSRVPGNMCTSCPVAFGAGYISSAGGGNIRWVVRWGRTRGDVAEAIYRTSGAAPASGPFEQETAIVLPAPATADLSGRFAVQLDVRDFIGRRGFPAGPDGMWISLERDPGHVDDTHGGDVALVNVTGSYVVWSAGGFIDLP